MIPITLDITWAILFFCWLIALPSSILITMERISLLGVYHEVKLTETNELEILKGFFRDAKRHILAIFSEKENEILENEKSESFYTKFRMMLNLNFVLSFLFMITYYIVIRDAVEWKTSESYNIFCFSLVLTLVSLITVRLLANQSNLLLENTVRMPYGISKEKIAEEHNTHVIAHFHTLICTSLMIILIILSASIINNQYAPQTLSAFDLLSFLYVSISYLFVFIFYIITLIILTFIVEVILLIFPPVVKISDRDWYLTNSSFKRTNPKR